MSATIPDLVLAVRPIADMLDSLGIGAYLLDDDDRTVFWNSSFLRLFPEHDGHIFVGEHYSENLRRFYHSRLDPAELAHIDTYIAHGIARNRQQFKPFEFLHRKQWLRVASLPVVASGRMRIWTAINPPTLDAEALANSMARHGKIPTISLINDIADGLMVRDPGGRVLFVNRRFCEIYSLTSEAAAVGETLDSILCHAWSAARLEPEVAASIADDLNFAGAPFVLALPEDRWVRVSEHRALDGSGISTHIDITDLHRLQRRTVEAQTNAEQLAASLRALIDERDRAEAALRQSQRVEAVGQLTSGLAHDFNNLLSVMLANLERLETSETDSSRIQRLQVIRSAVDRGAALTDKLLAFARKQPLQPSSVDLARMVAEMLPLLRTACGAGVAVLVDVPDGTPAALVDQSQLELVVLNLAINARDAMPSGGTLRITARRELLEASPLPDAPAAGEYVVLSVADNGTGMTEEVLARAVEPFFTTKELGSGSGLGLSQAYGLARQSGGTVQIDSTPGVGTTISVLLPMSPTAVVTGTRDAEPDGQTQPCRILLVDDEAMILDGMSESLEDLGYQITAIEGGEAAMRALEAGLEFDLLVTDVRMPVFSGHDLARWIWERQPGFPVLFITGFAEPDSIVSLGDNCRLLRKPCPSRDIQAAISALMRRESRQH